MSAYAVLVFLSYDTEFNLHSSNFEYLLVRYTLNQNNLTASSNTSLITFFINGSRERNRTSVVYLMGMKF